MIIRFARDADAPAIAAIYAPYVEDTAISFEYDPPTANEMMSRMKKVRDDELPWLVATDNDELLGYAYATKHKERAGYQWCVESSVYVGAASHRTGIGHALYTRLFGILRELGYENVYAGTTVPNDQSVNFHKSFGFIEVGRYPNVGFKHGEWHDTVWWHLAIGEQRNPPAPLKRLREVTLPPD